MNNTPEESDVPLELNQNRVVERARSIDTRLGQQMTFLVELDRLKSVLRRSLLIDGSRFENSAEHSWHLAIELRGLWDEYEARDTPTAQFAYAIDRLQPLVLNASAGGVSWLDHGISEGQVRTMNKPIDNGSKILWNLASGIIDDAVTAGALKPLHAPRTSTSSSSP